MFRFLERPDCVMSAPVKALITHYSSLKAHHSQLKGSKA